ncbi:unnamed protein product [Orchesella dallaii]|uniref:Lipoprotein n=1 Tax=Orchesella dallaii TaxID=48710 RepID=A0ABP1R8Z0_9HEXA
MKVLFALAVLITLSSCASISDGGDGPMQILEGKMNVSYINLKIIGFHLGKINATNMSELLAGACDTRIEATQDGDVEVLELVLYYHSCNVYGMNKQYFEWFLGSVIILAVLLWVLKIMLEKVFAEEQIRRQLRERSVRVNLPRRPIKIIRVEAI